SRLWPAWPESSAESTVAPLKASTGAASGHVTWCRPCRSRSCHSQTSVRSASVVSDSVMENPSPSTKAISRTRRAAVTSVRVPLDDDPCHGERDDLEIERERPPLDVLEVVLDALLERRVAAQPVDLRPPRDARLHLVAEHVAGHGLAEPLDEDRTLRARTHN